MSTKPSNNFTNSPFQDGMPVYLFTNENISGLLETMGDISGKQVLTVASSGDHAFESYLAGASHVNTFDINSYQKNILELKNHMIKHLKYSDFMNFFFDNSDFFNPKILTPIMHRFSVQLKEFMSTCTNTPTIRLNFKYLNACSADYNIKNLQYIYSEQNYNKLATLLPDAISFKHCDISTTYRCVQHYVQRYGIDYLTKKSKLSHLSAPKLYANFFEKYDLILMSNIFDYLFPDTKDTSEKLCKTHLHILSPLLSNNLNTNGRIYFHYIWGNHYPNAWLNFIQYFESQHQYPAKMFTRTIQAANKCDKFDTVLYAKEKTR